MVLFKKYAGLGAALAFMVGTWLAFSHADDATPPAGMVPVADFPKEYKGTPFTDSTYKGGDKGFPERSCARITTLAAKEWRIMTTTPRTKAVAA